MSLTAVTTGFLSCKTQCGNRDSPRGLGEGSYELCLGEKDGPPASRKAGASVLSLQGLNSASNHGNLKEAPELCRGELSDHTLRAGLGDPAKPCLMGVCNSRWVGYLLQGNRN